jgi:hypothetical protein
MPGNINGDDNGKNRGSVITMEPNASVILVMHTPDQSETNSTHRNIS